MARKAVRYNGESQVFRQHKYRHVVWPTYIMWYTLFQNADLFQLEMAHHLPRFDFFRKSAFLELKSIEHHVILPRNITGNDMNNLKLLISMQYVQLLASAVAAICY